MDYDNDPTQTNDTDIQSENKHQVQYLPISEQVLNSFRNQIILIASRNG